MHHTARRFWLSECTGPRAKSAVDIEDRVLFYRFAAQAAQADRTARGETLEIRSLPEICSDVALLGQDWRSRDDSEDAWDAVNALEAEHMEATATQLQAGDSTVGDYGLVEADPETDLLAPSESFVRAGECLFFSARRIHTLMGALGLLGPPADAEMCQTCQPEQPCQQCQTCQIHELPRVSAPQFALAHAGRTINDSISRTLESKAVEFVRGEWMFKMCAPLGVIDAFMNENGVSYATFTEACAENAREVSSFIRGGTFDAVEDIVQAANDHSDDNRYLFALMLLIIFLLDNGPAGLGGKAEESLIVLETHIDEMSVPSVPRDGAQIISALGAWFVRDSEEVYRADDPIAALWQWATLTQTHYALKALSGRASNKRRSLPKKHGT